MRRSLVTGASGFIGGRLVDRLVALGDDVHGVSRSHRENTSVVWHVADVSTPALAQALIAEIQPDVIYHLASRVTGSRDSSEILPTLEANLVSTVGLLLGALEHGCRRIVLAGSMEEGGVEAGPGSPYAAAKLGATGYARMFHLVHAVSVVNLRLFMVYGPGQNDTTKLVPYTITSLLSGIAPELGSGIRAVDWVYVDDVVDALVAAAAADEGDDGRPIDVGSGEQHTIRETVEEICRRIPSSPAPRFGTRPDRLHEATEAADLSGALRLLGWEPRTSWSKGLDATVAWYAARSGYAAAAS